MNKARKLAKTATLTPAKAKFAQVYAETDNATAAVRAAYPGLANPGTLAVKGHRLLRNDNVRAEIELQKKKLDQLAGKAIARVETLLDSKSEKIATTNAWNVIQQTHGRPTQKVESQSVNLNVDTVLEMLN